MRITDREIKIEVREVQINSGAIFNIVAGTCDECGDKNVSVIHVASDDVDAGESALCARCIGEMFK